MRHRRAGKDSLGPYVSLERVTRRMYGRVKGSVYKSLRERVRTCLACAVRE